MSALDSLNLGDFLRVKEEDENRRRVDSLAGLTLGDILLGEKRVAVAETRINRTLLDIIHVPEPSSVVDSDHNQNQVENRRQSQSQNRSLQEKKSWRAFKERLLLKRNGAVWSSSEVHLHRHNNNNNSRRHGFNFPAADTVSGESTSAGAGDSSSSLRGPTMRLGDHMLLDPTFGSSRRLSAALNDDRELSEREASAAQEAATSPQTAAEGESDGEQPVRMSLMELLEETTERQMGMTGARYDVEGDEEEEEEAGLAAAPVTEQKCCVCMVRHKGAAFIPCGHTFCRLCSREVFVQRGNCPLCNAQISEILDIF